MNKKEVKLVEFQNDTLAEMVKNVLREQGIPFRIKEDFLQAGLGVGGSSASGAFTIIYVKPGDLESAQKAIAGMV
ncbi:MAG: DUF2007 domain-containing protein [Candidatus Marinimicrobia bacterium]|nr:DUF2007 domain-containing protein [Candidatus Neomarinimicrobiota bacterium]